MKRSRNIAIDFVRCLLTRQFFVKTNVLVLDKKNDDVIGEGCKNGGRGTRGTSVESFMECFRPKVGGGAMWPGDEKRT